MNLSLIGSQMSREALSEQSSIPEGASYDEVFSSGHEPKSFSWLSERETSAQSPDKEVGSYGKEGREEIISKGGVISEEGEVEEGEEERDSDGDGDDDDEESYEGTSGSPGGNRPFILPSIWTVNDFLPKMSDRIFKELRALYQIPDHIPIHLPKKNEK